MIKETFRKMTAIEIQQTPSPATYAKPYVVLSATIAIALAFAVAYFQSFSALVLKWSDDPNYSHGFLVIPIAI